MNWEALGAAGELVGALAVIATLFYLAQQVSGAKRAVTRQTMLDVNQVFNQIHLAAATNPELASAMAKSESGTSLSDQDLVQLRHFHISLFNAFENVWVSAITEGMPTEETGQMLANYLLSPGVEAMWQTNGWSTSAEFQDFANEALRRAKAATDNEF